MGKKRAAKNEPKPLRFDEKLVLNQWMLSLFEVSSFDKLAEHLKSLELEGLDENNVHKFLHQIKLLWEYNEFTGDTLLSYDQNRICKKCSAVNAALHVSEAEIARERGAKRMNGLPLDPPNSYESSFF